MYISKFCAVRLQDKHKYLKKAVQSQRCWMSTATFHRGAGQRQRQREVFLLQGRDFADAWIAELTRSVMFCPLFLHQSIKSLGFVFYWARKKGTCGVTVWKVWSVGLTFSADLKAMRVWGCWFTACHFFGIFFFFSLCDMSKCVLKHKLISCSALVWAARPPIDMTT